MLRFLTAAALAMRVANIRGLIRAAAIRTVLAAIGLLFVVAAAGFGLFALHMALAPRLGPIGAAGAIAGALLLVGLILLALARCPPRKPSAGLEGQVSASVKEQYQRAARALGTGAPFTNPIMLLAGAALLAGYLMGRRRKKRD
ncbi:MAG: LPXTG cell wall anchor domain-containing protein [Hyphomicrobiales bacterium]|nr:LPXTG cell wall anchor domain-containing protein [Hyphomicrobiales bacterium]